MKRAALPILEIIVIIVGILGGIVFVSTLASLPNLGSNKVELNSNNSNKVNISGKQENVWNPYAKYEKEIDEYVVEKFIKVGSIKLEKKPDFSIEADENTKILRGNLSRTIYFVYSPYCPHCGNEKPVLENFHKYYNFTIVMISGGKNIRKIIKFLTENNITWDGGVPLTFFFPDEDHIVLIEGYPSRFQEKDGYFGGREAEFEVCKNYWGKPVLINGTYYFCFDEKRKTYVGQLYVLLAIKRYCLKNRCPSLIKIE